MENWQIGILIRPLFFLLLWVCVIYWVKRWFWRTMKPGKLKDFLFKER